MITSCLRLTTIDIQATTTDQTYDIASTMWTIVEMNVAILCACLPQIRPLLFKLFPKIMPYYGSKGKESDPPSSGEQSKPVKRDDIDWAIRTELSEVTKTHTNQTSIRAKDDAGSEENILQGDHIYVQRQVRLSVEYPEARGAL